MRIHIPNSSQQAIGGGWTFIRNFKTGIERYTEHKVVDLVADCDVYFICGATMVQRIDVEEAKAMGKKIVLRVDNIPRNSRNRNTSTSRLKDFAALADLVIYQSKWAQDYAGYFVGKEGVVIYNGVDEQIFYKKESVASDPNAYLYVQFNRDENKRFPEAAMLFHYAWRENHDRKLILVGQFSPELQECNFDFFMGEQAEYAGVLDPYRLAGLMRECGTLIFPAYADAAPNTVLEARACGMEIVGVNEFGGTKEMLEIPWPYYSLEKMIELYIREFENL